MILKQKEEWRRVAKYFWPAFVLAGIAFSMLGYGIIADDGFYLTWCITPGYWSVAAMFFRASGYCFDK